MTIRRLNERDVEILHRVARAIGKGLTDAVPNDETGAETAQQVMSVLEAAISDAFHKVPGYSSISFAENMSESFQSWHRVNPVLTPDDIARITENLRDY